MTRPKCRWWARVLIVAGALTVVGLGWDAAARTEVAHAGLALPVGQSAPGDEVSAEVAPPTEVTATAGTNAITVTWSYTGAASGFVATAYQQETARLATAVDGAARQATITGLEGGSSYTVRVIALEGATSSAPATSAPVVPSRSAATYAGTVLADGPVAYYRLGERSGTVAADSSGEGRLADYLNAGAKLAQPSPLRDDADPAVEFIQACGSCQNGSLRGRTAAGLPVGDQARTIEGWVKTHDGGGQLAAWGYGQGQFGVSVSDDDVSVETGTGQSARLFADPRVNRGQWRHVVVTYDDRKVGFYVNGVKLHEESFESPLATTAAPLQLGRFWGEMSFDEVAVYDRALTAAEVVAHFRASGNTPLRAPGDVAAVPAGPNAAKVSWTAPAAAGVTSYEVTAFEGSTARQAVAVPPASSEATVTGLKGGSAYTFQVRATDVSGPGPAASSPAVTITGPPTTYAATVLADSPAAYYRFDDGGTPTALDSSGHQRPAAHEGEPIEPLGDGALPSDPSGALSFSQTCGDFGCEPGTGRLQSESGDWLPTGAIPRSLEAWFRTSSEATLAAWGPPGSDGERFDVGVAGTDVVVDSGRGRWAFSAPYSLTDGNWHQLIVTYDGERIRAYVDGRASVDGPTTATLHTAAGPLTVGSGAGGQLSGSVDEVAVYHQALSPADVTAHWDASGNVHLGAPSDLAVSAGPNAATATWSPAIGAVPKGEQAVTTYLVAAYEGTSMLGAVAVAGDQTTATIGGLRGGTAYTLRVNAIGPFGAGPVATSDEVRPTGPATTYASTVLADAPELYYRAEDPSGQVAADSSGHGRHGSYDHVGELGATGALANESSVATSRSYTTALAGIPTGDQPRTIEAWVKTRTPGAVRLASWGGPWWSDDSFAITADRGQLELREGTQTATLSGATSITDGGWHHVVATYANGVVTGVVDGQSIGTARLAAALATPASAITVNADSDDRVVVDEFAVYAQALTPAQAASHFAASGNRRPELPLSVVATAATNAATVSWETPAHPVHGYVVTASAGARRGPAVSVDGTATSVTLAGLAPATGYTFDVVAFGDFGWSAPVTSNAVTPLGGATYAQSVLADDPSAYYRLGDPSGGVAADSSGHDRHADYLANDGSIGRGDAGALAGDPDPAVALANRCTRDCELPQVIGRSASTLGPAASRAIEFWVNTNGETRLSGQGLSVRVGDTTLEVAPTSASWMNTTFTTGVPLAAGQWHHIAVSHAAGKVTAFVDGRDLGTRALSVDAATHDPVLIGDDRRAFRGASVAKFDEVATYDHPLTLGQVQSHFVAGGGAFIGQVPDLQALPGTHPGSALVRWTPPDGDVAATGYLVTAITGTTEGPAVAVGGATTQATITGLRGGVSYRFAVTPHAASGPGRRTLSDPVAIAGSSDGYAATVLDDAPLAYYRLDDPDGPLAADSSGHERLADIVQPSQVGRNPGGAIVDGDGSMTFAPEARLVARGGAMPTSNTPRSVEGWVKGSGHSPLARWGTDGLGTSFAVTASTRAISVGTRDFRHTLSFDVPTSLADGQWHHVVVAYDGDNATAYVDGEQVGTKQSFASPLQTDDGPLTLGEAQSALDEVAIYAVALTREQVRSHFAASGNRLLGAVGDVSATAGPNAATVTWSPPSGSVPPGQPLVNDYVVAAVRDGVPRQTVVVAGSATRATVTGLEGGAAYALRVAPRNGFGFGPAATSAAVTPTGPASTYATTVLADRPSLYHRFGEAAGTVAYDSSGNGSDGSYGFGLVGLGAPGALATDASKAVQLRAGGQVAGAIADARPPADGAWTWEAWVRTGHPGWSEVARLGDFGDDGWVSVSMAASSLRLSGNAAGGDAGSIRNLLFTSPIVLTDDNFHHLVVTYAPGAPSTFDVFVDGKSVGSQSSGTPWPLGLSSYSSTGSSAGQILDEVAVYDHALSSERIGAHHAAAVTVPNQPPTVTFDTGDLVGTVPFAPAFEFGATDPEDDPLVYRFDFGDGVSSSGAVTGAPVTHTYTRAGSYVARLLVGDGHNSVIRTRRVIVNVAEPLAANAGDDQIVLANTAVHFDGTASRPAVGIEEYLWDFGDGERATGPTADHVFKRPGTYQVGLTVRASQQASSDTATVEVLPAGTSTLDVKVTDAKGVALAGADVVVFDADGRRFGVTTGPQGTASLAGLPDSSYTVYATAGGNYKPGKATAVIENKYGSVTIVLENGAAATTSLTVKRLTLDEIKNAGIDINDPRNANTVQFNIQLNVGLGLVGFASSGGFQGCTRFVVEGRTLPCLDSSGPVLIAHGGYRWWPSVSFVSNQPLLTFLQMPGEGRFLKEFFEARLVVTNLASPDFVLKIGSATLQLPAGVSLASTKQPQDLTQNMGDIVGGMSATANWILRGDVEGDYHLAATYAASLEPVGTTVSLEARTTEPFHVYGTSAVRMVIDADETANVGLPFHVRVGLENVSPVPVYNAAVTAKKEGKSGFIYQPRQRLEQTAAVIPARQTLWMEYILVPTVGGPLDLGRSFVSNLAGATMAPAKIITHPVVNPPDQVPEFTTKSLDKAVELRWAPVPSATAYQVFSTPDPAVDFPNQPAPNVDMLPPENGQLRAVARDVPVGTRAWYAISTLINGQPTIRHALVAGTSTRPPSVRIAEITSEISSTTPLYRLPVSVGLTGAACPAKLTAVVEMEIIHKSLCEAGGTAPSSVELLVPVFDLRSGVVNIEPNSPVKVSATVDGGQTWTDASIGSPPPPVWVGVGDSYTSGHHQTRTRRDCFLLPLHKVSDAVKKKASPKLLRELVPNLRGELPVILTGDEQIAKLDPHRCNVKDNDPDFSWVTRAVKRINRDLDVPKVWKMTAKVRGRSGEASADFADHQVKQMERDLLDSFGSWNIVSINGGADDHGDEHNPQPTFVNVLTEWYMSQFTHPSRILRPEPWLVETADPPRDCADVDKVFRTADRLEPIIHNSLQHVIDVAQRASSAVRIVDVLYPHVLPPDAFCARDARRLDGTIWHGTTSAVDRLNAAHDGLLANNLIRMDLRRFISTTWDRNNQLQRTMYYGFPHLDKSGQEALANAAVEELN